MAFLRTPAYVYRRPESPFYYFRFRFPTGSQAVLSTNELRTSLGTSEERNRT